MLQAQPCLHTRRTRVSKKLPKVQWNQVSNSLAWRNIRSSKSAPITFCPEQEDFGKIFGTHIKVFTCYSENKNTSFSLGLTLKISLLKHNWQTNPIIVLHILPEL